MTSTNQTRMEIVDKIKISIKTKFDNSVKILKLRETHDKNYTGKMFMKDMTKLIDFTQGKINQLKLPNGTFYNENEKCKNCKEIIEEEDFEECECCNKSCCNNCIIHTEDDRYLCKKCE